MTSWLGKARWAMAVWILLSAIGCGGARFRVPTAAPVPRSDGTDIWQVAAASCPSLETLSADLVVPSRTEWIGVTGLRLSLAVDRAGHIAIDGRLTGSAVFSLRGSAASATLVLPNERRAVTAPAAELFDAVAGLRVEPRRLLYVLGGCLSAAAPIAAENVGDLVRLRLEDADAYLTERGGRWRVRAGRFDGIVADYGLGASAWPREIRLTAEGEVERPASLTLRVDRISTLQRDPSVFEPRVPAGVEPASIEWLRENGPTHRPLAR